MESEENNNNNLFVAFTDSGDVICDFLPKTDIIHFFENFNYLMDNGIITNLKRDFDNNRYIFTYEYNGNKSIHSINLTNEQIKEIKSGNIDGYVEIIEFLIQKHSSKKIVDKKIEYDEESIIRNFNKNGYVQNEYANNIVKKNLNNQLSKIKIFNFKELFMKTLKNKFDFWNTISLIIFLIGTFTGEIVGMVIPVLTGRNELYLYECLSCYCLSSLVILGFFEIPFNFSIFLFPLRFIYNLVVSCKENMDKVKSLKNKLEKLETKEFEEVNEKEKENNLDFSFIPSFERTYNMVNKLSQETQKDYLKKLSNIVNEYQNGSNCKSSDIIFKLLMLKCEISNQLEKEALSKSRKEKLDLLNDERNKVLQYSLNNEKCYCRTLER